MTDGLEGALKEIGKRATENSAKQPGWVYLLVIIYLVLYFGKLPPLLPIKEYVEVWATALTYGFYLIGDALDKITFKMRDANGDWVVDRFPLKEIKDAQDAQDEFGVKDGIYDVSIKILDKAGRANEVHFWNETAKTFRGLLLPLGLLGFAGYAIGSSSKFTLLWAQVVIALVLLTLMAMYVLAYEVYPRWKNHHRVKLYEEIVACVRDPKNNGKITYQQLGSVRMFFWKETLVATVRTTAPVGPNILTA
jgi:hypothetical protein